MSEVKMMDFFKLPANELVKVIDHNKASVLNCDGVSEFQAIDVAVSAYDNNQALIKKLQEQIELLRKELTKFVPAFVYDENGDQSCCWGEFVYNEDSEHMGESVIAVLEATESESKA